MGVVVSTNMELSEWNELQGKEEENKKIGKLEVQLKATNEVLDFQEELIVELAQKVY